MFRRSLSRGLGALLICACGDVEPARIELLRGTEPGVLQSTCTLREPCAPATPHCDVDECVECLTDDHCGNGQCDRTVGACVECVTDADCQSDKPHCFESKCVECLQTAHCSETSACDLGDNKCKPRCTSNDDCGGPKPL